MKKDIIINLLITVGMSISLFLVNKYFALYLGLQNLGIMKLFTQILAYLNLAEIGLASASAYAFYKPLVEKNIRQVSIVFNTITLLYNKIFLFILVVGLGLNPVIPFFIKEKVVDKTIYLYWSLYVIGTALNYTFIKYSILLTADQKYRIVRLIEGGSRISYQILQIFVIIKYQSFFYFILLLILNNLIQYVCYKLFYKKHYKYIVKINKKDETIVKNLKNLFWHKVGGLIVYNTDLILISKFISLEIVGVYASYLMVIQMIIAILNIILNVLKPRIGKFIAEHNEEDIFFYFKNLNILFLGISILFTFCTYKLIDDFIILWLGKEFVLSKLTVFLILINLFVQSFRGIIDIFKDGFGFFDDIQLPIIESIINLIISIILVQIIGLNGVIIGTICSNILIIFIAKPIVVFKRCFNRDFSTYFKIYGNYIVLLIISFISCNYMANIINLNFILSWINWIFRGIILISISGVTIFVIFLSNRNFRNVLFFITKNSVVKK